MGEDIKIIKEIVKVLKSRIFSIHNKGNYLFDDDTYAILPGNISLFFNRQDIVWKNIKAKHKYSIVHNGSDFIFRTYRHELSRNTNDFVISVNCSEPYTVTLTPVGNKAGQLDLVSI